MNFLNFSNFAIFFLWLTPSSVSIFSVHADGKLIATKISNDEWQTTEWVTYDAVPDSATDYKPQCLTCFGKLLLLPMKKQISLVATSHAKFNNFYPKKPANADHVITFVHASEKEKKIFVGFNVRLVASFFG